VSPAHAGFFNFVLSNPANPNEVALVGEQIFAVGGGQLDYEFLVRNIRTVGITRAFTGVGNKALALAGNGGAPWVATAAGGADAANGFPAVAAGGAFGPLISNAAGATNPFSPVLWNSWGFEQFDDRVAAGGLPTNYVVRWFNTGLSGPLPVGFFTRFDLFSTFPPTPGGGGVDPPTGDVFFGLDDLLLDPFNNPLFDSTIANPNITSCTPSGPSDPNCGNSATIPGGFSGAQGFGVSEPATYLLGGGGFIAMALVLRRRK